MPPLLSHRGEYPLFYKEMATYAINSVKPSRVWPHDKNCYTAFIPRHVTHALFRFSIVRFKVAFAALLCGSSEFGLSKVLFLCDIWIARCLQITLMYTVYEFSFLGMFASSSMSLITRCHYDDIPYRAQPISDAIGGQCEHNLRKKKGTKDIRNSSDNRLTSYSLSHSRIFSCLAELHTSHRETSDRVNGQKNEQENKWIHNRNSSAWMVKPESSDMSK